MLVPGLSLQEIQVDADSDVEKVISNLRSTRPDVRDEAQKLLRSMGKRAKSALERASNDLDPEVSSRAKFLLRALSIEEALSISIVKSTPGIVNRLASANVREWTTSFLEISQRCEARDYEFLILPALRGAQSGEEKRRLISLVRINSSPAIVAAVAPELERWIADSDPCIRHQAGLKLVELSPAVSLELTTRLLSDGEPCVRLAMLRGFMAAGLKSAVPAVERLLSDQDVEVRRLTVRALATLRSTASEPHLRKVLREDPDAGTRAFAARALAQLAFRDATDDTLPLLKSDAPLARRIAVEALELQSARKYSEGLVPMLRDPDVQVRLQVADTLCHLGSKEGVPLILGGGGTLLYLNALRKPELWDRLRAESFDRKANQTRVEELLVVASRMKLRIDSSRIPGAVLKGLAEQGQETTGLEVLRGIVADGVCDAVVDSDCIRILTPKDALEFWKSWWEVEQRK